MKKKHLLCVTVVLLALLLTTSSCIGSFAMFNKVKAWNSQVSNKFVNELIFVAMWVLPVYPLSFVSDLLVINAVEFWSGVNPMLTPKTKIIKSRDTNYQIDRDNTGYTITNLSNHQVMRLNFKADTRTWSIESNGQETTLMTFVDDQHVKMPIGNGECTTIELSQAGVLAYQQAIIANPASTLLANR